MKRYGIRLTLPKGDPMALPHLLGASWESFRWYDDAGRRDAAFEDLQHEHVYSRRGDIPSFILEKVEK